MPLPGRLLNFLYRSPAYALLLRGTPSELIGPPPDPILGEPEVGQAILDGQYPTPVGFQAIAPDPWHMDVREVVGAALHSFSWLRDLMSVDTVTARANARALTSSWLARYDQWHPVAWRADVTAERVVRWLTALPQLAGDDPALARSMLISTSRQVRHLSHLAKYGENGPDGFAIACGLVVAGTALDSHEYALTVGLATLARALSQQILADGGHVSRNPSQQFAVLEHLIVMRDVLEAAGHEVPIPVLAAIERMVPFLRAMRLGDGGLSMFNGAVEGSAARIDSTLSLSSTRSKAIASAPQSGYQRLSAGRVVLVADVGGPPPAGLDASAHAGPLAFEMSVGRRRLIVNCGAHADRSSPWHRALKATAAHSSLTVDDSNAFTVGENGIEDRAVVVSCRRSESDGNAVIEAYHDGYRPRLGVIHRRDVYLSVDGADVRGRDLLEGGGSHRYVARFHLHPDVKAILAEDGSSALLKLSDGEGWRLRTAGGRMAIEESVYHGGGEPRRTLQITVSGAFSEGNAEMKWGLRREGE